MNDVVVKSAIMFGLVVLFAFVGWNVITAAPGLMFPIFIVAIVLGAAGLTYWYKRMGGKKRVADILDAKKEANIKKHFSKNGGGGAEVVDISAVDAVELG